MQLEPIPELEALGKLAVGGAKVPDEASDRAGLRLCERREEWSRVALAEEAARVRDAKAVARPVVEPIEVVEVAPVGDRQHLALGFQRAGLLGDGVGGGHD